MTSTCGAKVVMADQHAMLAESVGIVLARRQYRYEVVPLAEGGGSTDQVLRRLRSARPDVLLLASDLGPGCNGVDLVAPMTRAGTAVLVLTDVTDPVTWGECLTQGARGVLPKTASLATVVGTVRRALSGETVMDRDERMRCVHAYRRHRAETGDASARLDTLSPHEAEVLRHLMAGRTVKEVARIRVVSEGTVRTQVKAVLAKLGVRTQLTAVAVAHRAGWGTDRRLPAAG